MYILHEHLAEAKSWQGPERIRKALVEEYSIAVLDKCIFFNKVLSHCKTIT